MKRLLLFSAVILALTAAGATADKAAAQPGPPAPGMDPLLGPLAQPDGSSDAPASGAGMDPGTGPGGMGPAPGPGRCGPGGRGPGGPGWDHKFSLFAPVTNKNLSFSDVKIIAAALLLEHGNHTWQVSDILPEPNQMIEFSYTSQHGDIIASFDINTITGEITRVN
jgi:hypothetical protein